MPAFSHLPLVAPLRFLRPALACLLAASALVAPLAVRDAEACGGCVSPPLPPDSPLLVKQAGERILFVRDDKKGTSTVHIEIRYTGLAKDFGWVLPLPEVPKVSVGSDLVFDALDVVTRPTFTVQYGAAENCRDPSLGCKSFTYPDVTYSQDASAGGWDSASSPDTTDSGPPPGVEILSSGETGPFQYLVLAAKDATPLLDWLNQEGYSLPASANAIVQSHLDKGDVFVALKLQNGQGIEAIRPIVLEMPGAEACVPLRLTSIAAVEDMDVQVFLVGQGRGIPKNTLHVEPNPVRFSWPYMQPSKDFAQAEPVNYLQTLSAAIDEADGAAFVTEFAQPGLAVPALGAQETGHVAQTKSTQSLSQLASWISWSLSLTSPASVITAIDVATDLPEQLSATATEVVQYVPFCHQQFWYQGGNSPTACLAQYLQIPAEQVQAAKVDGLALAEHVQSQWWAPLAAVQAVIKDTAGSEPWLTRLHMRVDPAEMDRDPLFGFNPTLPGVKRDWKVEERKVCTDGWWPAESTRLSFDGLGSWVGTGIGLDIGKVLQAPAALRIELLDEQGPPMIIAAEQAPQVAAAVAGAVPGSAQLPPGFVIVPGSEWTPPASDLPLTQVGPWPMPPYCVPKNGWVDGKLPPDKEIPDAPDVVGLDVAGVDTWRNVEDATSNAETSPQPPATTRTAKGDGCSARPVAPASWGWAVGLVALLGLGRLRQRARTLLR